ncbi:MAG: DUF2779 domain-containing protein [Allosphingosinicella sp.]|uniref:DUF2779 domain-containing protein n=1 Tax=Allosphingosinicella sp. TaxID=2823234 RepID=UPI00394EE29F
MIEAEPDLASAVAETARLIASGWRRPIFEGTFAHDGVLIRADLMLPIKQTAWHVAEVKSSTSAKGYHLADAATQAWVLRECGIEVGAVSIRHVNSDFELSRDGDYEGLFKDQFIDRAIEPIIADRPRVVADARAVLAGDEPTHDMGEHCSAPFKCEFQTYCGRHLPPGPEWPAEILPDGSGKKIARAWAERGVSDLIAIPRAEMTSPKLARVHEVTLSGEPYCDVIGIQEKTSDWCWPRHYLDFETIAFAVPRWIGTKPWQQVPFQFSCHTELPDGRVEHHQFLSFDGQDPRRACAEALVAILSGDEAREGCVITYNASFERRCLSQLADVCPDLAEKLHHIRDRVVDLLPVMREHYYHRDQRGSWSIKAVLPTLCPELSYSDLQVKAGDDAQAAYLEAISPETSPERRESLRSALLAYCERDTLAMVELLRRASLTNSVPAV